MWEGFQLEQGGPKTGEWTVRRGEAESCLILAGSGGCTAGCGGQVVPWGVLVCTVGTANRSTLWPQRLEGGAPWADVDAAAGTGCGHVYKGQLKAKGRVLNATRMMTYRGLFRKKK